jgi:O-antigen ligase
VTLVPGGTTWMKMCPRAGPISSPLGIVRAGEIAGIAFVRCVFFGPSGRAESDPRVTAVADGVSIRWACREGRVRVPSGGHTYTRAVDSEDPRRVPRQIGGARAGIGVAVLLSLVAWLVGVLALAIPPLAAGVVGFCAGLGIGARLGRRDPIWVVVAFLPSTALIGSVLNPSVGHYLPILTVGAAALAVLAPRLVQDPRSLILPARPILLVTVLYLVWFAVATVPSIHPRASLEYLLGAAVTLTVALVAIPTMTDTDEDRRTLALCIGALGPILVVAGVLLTPLTRAGLVGTAPPLLRMTLGGGPTPLVFPRLSGIYPSPAYEALALAVGLLALLAMLPTLSGRARRWAILGVVLVIVGLMGTMDRNGLLAATAGATALVILRWHRGAVAWPLASAAVVGTFVVLILANVVGASLPGTTGGNDAGLGFDETPVRGGTSLSGRDLLWRASLEALGERPLVGYGPGMNADAIAPFVAAEQPRFVGLTSHDTWLRTAVELGIVGLVLLLWFVTAVLVSIFRRAARSLDDPVSDGLSAIFIALLFGFTFETFLLGGVSYPSFIWATAAGILAAGREAAESVHQPGRRSAPRGSTAQV